MSVHQPLEARCYYHIYNRGINKEDIFKQEKNYYFFLEKYALYLQPVVETYAYSLLGNHFHLFIRVKDQETLNTFYLKNKKSNSEGLHSADYIVSKQFGTLFNCYTQAINRAFGRTGSLFEKPFKRIKVENEVYYTRLIRYIHQNPQKHGFVEDFKTYPFSSFQSFLFNKPTKLNRQDVLSWFGTKNEFLKLHQMEVNGSADYFD